MSKPIIAEMPSIQANVMGCNKLIFCLKETIIKAATVAAKVAIIQGIKISVGLAAGGLTEALIAIILTGIRVSPDACKTINMICELLAVSLSGFKVCKLSIAFKPKGVAALSKPSRLAEKFIIICPMAGCFGGTSGNNLPKKGPTIRDKNRMAPAFSPMFMNPKKSVMMPISLKERSTLSPADLNIPSVMVLKIVTSPVTAHLKKAITKATIKKANHMKLRAIVQ